MAAKTDVAGRRIAKKGEPALAAYVDKDIPTVIGEFATWLQEQTGYADLDARSVYLGSSLRGQFQKSEANQKRIADRAAEIEQEKLDRVTRAEERAAAKIQRDADKAQRAADREAAAKEKAAAEKAAPKAAATKVPAPKAPAKKTGVSKAAPATPARRRPARPAAAKGATETDF